MPMQESPLQLIQTTPVAAIPPAFRREHRAVDTGDSPLSSVKDRLDRRQFETMQAAFQMHGGFAKAQEMVRHLQPHWDDPWSTLANWTMSRSVLVVTWLGQTQVPMFQFDLGDMSLRSACARVAGELKPVFDDWELALWFATPNIWLHDATPVDMLGVDAFAVVQAARTDRFIARG